MGFRLSSFLGGAAEQAVKTIESREKDARDTGLLAGKSLYAQYAAITKENAEVSAEIKDNLEVLKTNFSTMDEPTAIEIASRKSIMTKITAGLKDGSIDPKLIDINLLRTIVKDNAPEVAIGKIDQTTGIASMVKGMMTNKETDAALAEKKPKGLMDSYYEGFTEKGVNEYAASVGVSPEQMRGVKRLSDRPLNTNMTFDLSQLRPAEKYDALKDKAQVALVDATQRGDAAAIAKATEHLSAFTAVTTSQQSEVVRAAERRAKLDRVASEGGPEAVKAKEQIKVLDGLKRESNVATAITKVKGDGDDTKPFSFPNLKSAVTTSIAVKMSQEFGQQLKDNVAWVNDPSDNTLNPRFIGSDPALRKQFNDITTSTVERVLEGLNPNDQNVKMIRRVFNPPAATLLPQPPEMTDLEKRLNKYK